MDRIVATGSETPHGARYARLGGRVNSQDLASSVENLLHGERRTRKPERLEGVPARNHLGGEVLPPGRVPVGADHAGAEIDDPRFRNLRAGVQRDLDVAVVGKGGIRDFDDQEAIGRAGVGTVSVWARDQKHDTGLGRVLGAEDGWVLDVDDGAVPKDAREQADQAAEIARSVAGFCTNQLVP